MKNSNSNNEEQIDNNGVGDVLPEELKTIYDSLIKNKYIKLKLLSSDKEWNKIKIDELIGQLAHNNLLVHTPYGIDTFKSTYHTVELFVYDQFELNERYEEKLKEMCLDLKEGYSDVRLAIHFPFGIDEYMWIDNIQKLFKNIFDMSIHCHIDVTKDKCRKKDYVLITLDYSKHFQSYDKKRWLKDNEVFEFPKTKEDLELLMLKAISKTHYYRECTTAHYPDEWAIRDVLNKVKDGKD